MGAQLNIKDPITIELARTLANDLGRSVTGAIRLALEEKTDRVRNTRARPTVEDIMTIVRGSRGLFKPEFDGVELSTRHGELLYDEDGLPE